MSEQELRGQPPSPEHLFWRQALQDLRKNSLQRVEDAARQLIAVITVLSGLYFGAITFGQIPKNYALNFGAKYLPLPLLFVVPLALWALSVLCASLVLFPRPIEISPYDADAIEEAVLAALAHKYRLLKWALALLVVSLVWLVWAAWEYLRIYIPLT